MLATNFAEAGGFVRLTRDAPAPEIQFMLDSGLKYELDALANKDFQYLTNKYLPRKLKEKDWID